MGTAAHNGGYNFSIESASAPPELRHSNLSGRGSAVHMSTPGRTHLAAAAHRTKCPRDQSGGRCSLGHSPGAIWYRPYW